MKMWIFFSCVITVTAKTIGEQDILKYFPNPEPQLTLRPKITTHDRITDHDYPAETYHTITSDSYIITLFRIPYSHKLQNQGQIRPIVLIQHGLFSSSGDWMLNEPNDGIAFNLADAGFDVWLGKTRGNTYFRNHTSHSPNHPYFWRFSWHEIDHYDLAAMVDYALAENGQDQRALHYVDHSQGTTAFFTFLSTRPEYNLKIKTAHMLAPVAFMSNMEDKLVRTLAPLLGHHNVYAAFFDSQEFIPHIFTKLGYNACAPHSKFHKLCNSIAYMLEGPESNSNVTSFTILAQTHPARASTNQICYYMQEQQSGCFCQYDYGRTRNIDINGQPTPPDYPVTSITALWHLWYSDNDSMAAVEDVEHLASLLPNKVRNGPETTSKETTSILANPFLKPISILTKTLREGSVGLRTFSSQKYE